MRRLSVLAVLVLAGAAISMSAAWAKTPPFEMQVSPRTVTPGEPITVTVTFEVAGDLRGEDLTGLIGFAPAPPSGSAIRPLTGHSEVPLPRVRRGVYRGSVRAPADPGKYVVVPYPTVIGLEDSAPAGRYPEPAVITVTDRSLLANGAWPLAAVVGLALITVVTRRRRTAPSPSPGAAEEPQP